MMGRPLAVLCVLIAAAGFVLVPAGSSRSAGADLDVGLSGQTDGKVVGDVLRIDLVVFNLGPDGGGAATVDFTFDRTALTLVQGDSGQTCTDLVSSEAAGAVRCQIPEVSGEVGYTFYLRVDRIATSTLRAVLTPAANDPNPDNNSVSLVVLGPPAQFDILQSPTLSGDATVGSTITASTGEWNPSFWGTSTPTAGIVATRWAAVAPR